MRMPIRGGLLAAMLLAGAPALAGTVIETRSSDTGTSRMMVSGDQLRMESSGRVMLFDGGSDVMRFVDPATKSYTVMTKQDVAKLSQQMQSMREQMEKQLQNVPEDKRDAMREQMQSMMPGAGKPPSIRVEATGGSGSAAGASCEKAKVYLDDEAAHEVCVADPEAIGIPRSDFDSILAMFDFFDEIASATGGSSGELGAREMRRMMEKLGGMPVKATALNGGADWEIVRVEQQSLSGDRFDVPSGYEERKGMGQMGQ